MESEWVNKAGYSKQKKRDNPLAGIQIESLRIVDDATWYAAQERLEKLSQNAGRVPVDGDRQSRPRVINGLVYCPKHTPEQVLYVHGVHGKYMSCKACRDAPEPDLYSLLPRRLALDRVCDCLAGLILADESLVIQAIEAFQRHLQTLTQPDPGQADLLNREIERLTRQINFILDAPGETEQDQKENRDRLGELRSQRAAKQKRLAEFDEMAKKPATIPDVEELRAQVQQIGVMLREASRSDDPAELAALQDLIRDLTGGKILATQQGERKPHKGWVRLTFQVRTLDVLARRCGFPEVHGESVQVEIDVKEPDWKDLMCEKVKQQYDQQRLNNEIAEDLNLHRSQVTELLQYWSQKHGQELPDGRKRRSTLARKQRRTPDYKAIAERVKTLWDDPGNLAVVEIARQLNTTDTTAWKALGYWHRSRGLPVLTAKGRRQRIMTRAKAMFDAHVEIREIATALGYTPRGMKLLLKEAFAQAGEEMPDGRAHRHSWKKTG
jgi:hypothetical protein